MPHRPRPAATGPLLEPQPRPGGPIVVIGSINMDLICRAAQIPRPGQTVLGSDLMTFPGGKGANQAVGAAKLGATVHLIGRVGNDDFGQRLLNGLRQHQVDTQHVTVTEGISTGAAMILVDRKGENSIVVAQGANSKLTAKDIDAATDLIAGAAAVLLQLEIPLETAIHAVALCQRLRTYTILDPAPAPEHGLPRALYGVNVLTPNQHESEDLLLLTSRRNSRVRRMMDPKQIASDLLSRGARTVILKLGNKGAMIVGRDGAIERLRPFKVRVVDTTAAGDAVTAALAVARSEGKDLHDAVHFANAAGALCCTAFGAQPALPARDAVDKLIERR